jgi:L,D-peptidoglycan transpeptidase YkuD (ErfK/YbiS/YcfS/YnhG family)
MGTVALLSVVAGTLLITPTANAVRLDGVRVRAEAGTTQAITVNHTGGSRARVMLWRHTNAGWQATVVTERGRIGYGGLVRGDRRRQGSGTTPLGTYELPFAFGPGAARAKWDLPYRRFDGDDYWVQDNASRYYNRFRDRDKGGFRWWLGSSNANGSERLADYRSQYEMAIVTGFNYEEQVRRRGSGIFLHVNGSGATAGCVSVPRRTMRLLMRKVDPAREPVIAIGR